MYLLNIILGTTEASGSNEHKVFTEHQNDIKVTLTQNPLRVANILLEEKLIPSSVMNKIKIQVFTHDYKAKLLFEAVEEEIKMDSQKFQQFLEVFSTHELNPDLVTTLRKVYQTEGKYCS